MRQRLKLAGFFLMNEPRGFFSFISPLSKPRLQRCLTPSSEVARCSLGEFDIFLGHGGFPEMPRSLVQFPIEISNHRWLARSFPPLLLLPSKRTKKDTTQVERKRIHGSPCRRSPQEGGEGEDGDRIPHRSTKNQGSSSSLRDEEKKQSHHYREHLTVNRNDLVLPQSRTAM